MERSYPNGKIVSISVAKDDYYEADQPPELLKADTSIQWNNEGYRVDTDYYDFDIPVRVSNYRQWLADHYWKDSAFTRRGTGRQQYMCRLADEHAIFLLKKAISLQTGEEVLVRLQDALTEVVGR